MPAAAAAEAPPILKLCVFKFTSGIVECMFGNHARVRKDPSLKTNSGPILKGVCLYEPFRRPY